MTKILVVEDDPINMRLMSEILRSIGITADEAENGKEAIEKTEKEIYDLILMDIGLPDMDGIKTMKVIRSRPDCKDAPVIALTAFAMKGDKERFLAEGFNDYISKPINVPEFMEKLEKIKKNAKKRKHS